MGDITTIIWFGVSILFICFIIKEYNKRKNEK